MEESGQGDDDSIGSSSTSPSTSNSKRPSSASSSDSDMKDYRGFRMVTFRKEIVTQVHTIPGLEEDQLDLLFYDKRDFARFHANERKRHEKKMTKEIQKMVHEAMKDELQAAYVRGATQEEIDAMMPQTPEEIFAVLGGMSTPIGVFEPMTTMKPPPAVNEEHMHHHSELGSTDDGNLINSTDVPPNGIGDSDNDQSWDDVQTHAQYPLQDVPEAPSMTHDRPDRKESEDAGSIDESLVSSKNTELGGKNTGEHSRDRPEQLEDFSDSELYFILGVTTDEDSKDADTDIKSEDVELGGKNTGDHSRDRPEQLEDFSNSELYFILGVNTEKDSKDADTEIKPKDAEGNKPNTARADQYDGKKKNQHHHRPDHLMDFSDNDLYDILGVESNLVI